MSLSLVTANLSRLMLKLIVGSAIAMSSSALAADEISVFVPAFHGPRGLSASVTTILGLQIWQTLRRAGTGEDSGGDFGKGVLKTSAVNANTLTYAAAEKMARDVHVLSQAVLWGTVQPYGDGAIVQSFLSIPKYGRLNKSYYADFRTEHKEIWVVKVPTASHELTFSVDLPRRRLGFEPIVIRPQVIAHYSAVGAIGLYDPNNPHRRLGSIGTAFRAIEQRGNSALVTSNGVTGIAKLPLLSTHRSEIVDFVGGLVRVFRGDWKGGADSFLRVIRNEHSPTSLRIDAHLYRAMAFAQLGRSGQNEISQALALNPYLARTVTYAVMERLALVSRMIRMHASRSDIDRKIEEVRHLVQDHRRLFLKDDPWINNVLAGLREMKIMIHEK